MQALKLSLTRGKHITDALLIPQCALFLLRSCRKQSIHWMPHLLEGMFPLILNSHWKFVLRFMSGANIPKPVHLSASRVLAKTCLRHGQWFVAAQLVLHKNHFTAAEQLKNYPQQRTLDTEDHPLCVLLNQISSPERIGFTEQHILRSTGGQLLEHWFKYRSNPRRWHESLEIVGTWLKKLSAPPPFLPRSVIQWMMIHLPQTFTFIKLLDVAADKNHRLWYKVRRLLHHPTLWKPAVEVILAQEKLEEEKRKSIYKEEPKDMFFDADLLTDICRLEYNELSYLVCEKLIRYLPPHPLTTTTQIADLLLAIIQHAARAPKFPCLGQKALHLSLEYFPSCFPFVCPPYVNQALEVMVQALGWRSVEKAIKKMEHASDSPRVSESGGHSIPVPAPVECHKSGETVYLRRKTLNTSWEFAVKVFLGKLKESKENIHNQIFDQIFRDLIQAENLPARFCFLALMVHFKITRKLHEGILTEVILSTMNVSSPDELQQCSHILEKMSRAVVDQQTLVRIKTVLETMGSHSCAENVLESKEESKSFLSKPPSAHSLIDSTSSEVGMKTDSPFRRPRRPRYLSPEIIRDLRYVAKSDSQTAEGWAKPDEEHGATVAQWLRGFPVDRKAVTTDDISRLHHELIHRTEVSTALYAKHNVDALHLVHCLCDDGSGRFAHKNRMAVFRPQYGSSAASNKPARSVIPSPEPSTTRALEVLCRNVIGRDGTVPGPRQQAALLGAQLRGQITWITALRYACGGDVAAWRRAFNRAQLGVWNS